MLTTHKWLSPRQQESLEQLWAYDKDYGALKLAWLAYQAIIDCYQMGNKREAKKKMRTIIDQLRVLKGRIRNSRSWVVVCLNDLVMCWRISMLVSPTVRSKRSTDGWSICVGLL